MRRYPMRPKGHPGMRRAECLGALLGSFFRVRAGNVSFLKRDPHGRTLSRFQNLN